MTLETPVKNDDFKCKTTLKLRQKQFNILKNEYTKFLTYNDPSFVTTNSARSLFRRRIPQNKCYDLLILMAIILQKQTLATVNSLKVVELFCQKYFKTLLCPHTPPHSRIVTLTKYLVCLINPLTYFKPMLHL